MAARRRATLTDVSRQAGVSRSTVSLVLNGSSEIPERTANRVRQAIEAIGYIYNRPAAMLRQQHSHAMGFIATDVENPYFSRIAMAFEDVVSREGYTLLVGYTRDDLERQNRLIRTFVERGIDALVMLPAVGTKPEDVRRLTSGLGLPLIMLARPVEGGNWTYVGPDHTRAGELLGDHLAKIGARTVSFVGGDQENPAARDRAIGLRDALTRAHGGEATLTHVHSGNTPQAGVMATARLFDTGQTPDSIVAFNDMIAAAVYAELYARGLRPGVDVAVAGFDDLPASRHQVPPLTSVATYPDQTGEVSAGLILDAIAGLEDEFADEEARAASRVLPPDLRIRASTTTWRRPGR